MHEIWRVRLFSFYTDSILIQRSDSSFILCASRGIQEITGFPTASNRSFFSTEGKQRVIGIVSVSRSTCQLHPLPSRAMDSLGQCVSVEGCEWDALEWDVVQSASQLSSLPGLSGSCAAKVQGSRSQSTFYLCQVLAAAPPESMCSAPFNHTCQPQGPRPSHCHMCLAEPGIVLAGLCSSTEAAWTFSSSDLGFVEILWLLQAESYSWLRVASNVIGW